jgi:predicted DsbA family dithiol-disulfide isomerase
MNRSAKCVLFILLSWSSLTPAQQKLSPKITKDISVVDTTSNKLIIEIWSDIVCPFCYLGKRKFEAALEQFPQKEHIQIEWKSFQLNPGVVTDTTMSIYTYLSNTKGISEEVAKQMTAQITSRGKEVNIDYHFDETKVINTFNAHCLLHFAKEQGLQNEAKERLLKAYFTESKNVDDHETLLQLGKEIGLDREKLDQALRNGTFKKEVEADMELSQRFGIGGVPFFVFDRKYAVSGAQETAVFLETIQKSYSEWRKNNPEFQLEIIEGQSCAPDKKCD